MRLDDVATTSFWYQMPGGEDLSLYAVSVETDPSEARSGRI